MSDYEILSDPENPKILGELKIPGFSEYMYPYGDGLLLGFGMDADEDTGRTTYLKLSMFNITDPTNVAEQDKTIIDGYTYSSALDNHKSMLVSPSKNLIGFVVLDNRGMSRYLVYEYNGQGFTQKAEIEFESYDSGKFWDDIRGLFVGEYFYTISHSELIVSDVDTFSKVAVIK